MAKRKVTGKIVLCAALTAAACGGQYATEAYDPPGNTTGASGSSARARNQGGNAPGGSLGGSFTPASGQPTDGGTIGIAGATGSPEEPVAFEAAGGTNAEGDDFAGAAGVADIRYHSRAHWPIPNPVGSALPNPASYDTSAPDVITDLVTGLVWQRTPMAMSYSYGTASIACEDYFQLGNYSGWRLPTRMELVSLFASGYQSSDGNGPFEDSDGAFWSDSLLNGGYDYVQAWTVSPSTMTVTLDSVYSTNRVRCVRTGALPRPRNTVLLVGGDFVTDRATSLTWERRYGFDTDGTIGVDFDEANAYCKALTLGNQKDWRMPSEQELASLVDDHHVNPAIVSPAFEGDAKWLMGGTWAYVDPADSNSDFVGRAIRFYDGATLAPKRTDAGSVRCVRSAPAPTNSP